MNISNSGIIYQILDSKKINHLLTKITSERTIIEGKTISKKNKVKKSKKT